MVGYCVAGEGAYLVPRDGLDEALGHAVYSARKLLADVFVEADNELGFLGVFLAIYCRRRPLCYRGRLAVGDKLVVGRDV